MTEQKSPVFEVQGCGFAYGASTVLKDISFSLQAGCFYGLLGPNGSGKTTLLDLMMAAHPRQSGRISFLGRDIGSYNKRTLAQHIALVPQDLTIGFDYPVFDVVMMGRHPYIPRFAMPSHTDIDLVEAALAEMDVSALRDRPVTHLSGGERQRVLVARALAQDTGTLLLDEPTASLDIRHTFDIMLALRRRVSTAGITVIATIHDLDLAAVFCDELLVLKEGRLYRSGAVKEVMTSDLIRDVFSTEADISLDTYHHKPRVRYRYAHC